MFQIIAMKHQKVFVIITVCRYIFTYRLMIFCSFPYEYVVYHYVLQLSYVQTNMKFENYIYDGRDMKVFHVLPMKMNQYLQCILIIN